MNNVYINKSPIFVLSLVSLILVLQVRSGPASISSIHSATQDTHPANAMWIEPPIVAADVGDRFNVTVWINLIDDSYTWQFHLTFNATYFNVTDVGYTSGSTSEWATYRTGGGTMPCTPTLNNIDGYVEHGESCLGIDYVPGPVTASLAWVEFEVGKELALDPQSIDFDMMDTFMLGKNLREVDFNIYGADVIPVRQHELVVFVDGPSLLQPGDSSLLSATVYNCGLNNETNVELFLLINGSEAESVVIPELLTGSSYTLSYMWSPMVEATYNVTAYTPSVPAENVTNNNWDTEFTIVKYVVTIGIIETHGESLHTEELADYYTSLGHIVEKVSTTITLEVLSSYNIVIVGEGGGTWVPSEIAAVQAYIDSEGSFVAIGDQLGTSVQVILCTYGISYTGVGAPGGSSSYFDSLHPIMQGVSLIYAGAPTNSLQITSPAYWIANDVSDTYILIAGAEVGGYLLCLSDDFTTYLYDNDNEEVLKNIVAWMTVKYEHELTVSLDAPSFLRPSGSSLLNATVYNCGLNNETDVELYLLINGTTVNSTTISELLIGASHTTTHSWTPTDEAMYNITVHVSPVVGENVTANNSARKMVLVTSLRCVLLFDQTHGTDTINYYDTWVASLALRGCIVDTHYIGPIDLRVLAGYDVFVIPQARGFYTTDELSAIQSFVASGGSLLVIGDDVSRIYTDLTGFAGILWRQGGMSGITTNVTPHEVTQGVSSVYLPWPSARMAVTGPAQDVIRDPAGNIMLAYSEILGRVIGFADEDLLQEYGINEEDNLLLANNVIDWLLGVKYEHELVVSLDAPSLLRLGDSSLLSATVHVCGLSNETDVELQLLIDGAVVDFDMVPELPAGSSYTLIHLWTPTVEGTYNVTTRTPPMPNETIVINNVVTREVSVLTTLLGTYISIDSPKDTMSVQNIFSVNITVNNVTDLYTWQIKLYFDNTTVNFIEASCPPGHIFDGQPIITVSPYPRTDAEGTYVEYGCTLLGYTPRISGSGLLCELRFKAIGTGVCPFTFELEPLRNTFLLDSSMAEIPFGYFEGLIIVWELQGDLNRDRVVNMKDVGIAGSAFGSYPDHPRWNFIADVNQDDQVDMRDIALVASNFGKESL